MGVWDLDNDIDMDRARYDRENRLNPPPFPAGQDMDISSSNLFAGGMDDMSFDAPMSVDTMGINDAISSYDNSWTSTYGNGYNQNNYQQQQSQQQGFTYDKAVDMTKQTVGGLTQIFKSFKYPTSLFWYNYCFKLCIIGIVLSALGFLTLLFGFSKANILIISGLLGLFGGGCGWFILKDNSLKCTSEYKEDNSQVNLQQGMYDTTMPDMWSEQNTEPNWEEPIIPEVSEPYIEETTPEWTLEEPTDSKDTPMTTQEALESMQNVPQGMYTRQYLYDMFTKVLPSMKPNFSTLTEITPDDDAFHQMNSSLREAAEVCGVKEEVELERLQENFSTIICECTRPIGFKPDAVADELARIYAHRSKSDVSKVYAQAESVGRRCIITIFTGNSAMISLKDMLSQKESFFLDTNNYMPVVFGIDHKAEVVAYDFKKLESILITGMPRSGKSWFVQAVLTQMCALVPPSELNIYICDPKDGISDFKSFCLPHVKKFVSGDANIVNTLRRVVKEEAPKRKKIIGDAGFVNIWDYKERYPDVKLPIIYVLIDEVVTLAERMDKETKAEFQGLLVELISQLPALGIRAFLVPHVVKNDIIAKTATDLIPCRISVCGDAGHIEACTGTKPKAFNYKLTNKGDMAVRIPSLSPATMFIHGPALTESNPKNNDLFDYLRRVWGKLEPSEMVGSVAELAEKEDIISNSAKETENDDLDIFDLHSDDNFSEDMRGFRDTIIGG